MSRSITSFSEDAGSKQRLIAAAIDLFGEKGVDKVSLRELTGRAQANVAAVNYHFGSKEALAEAVFEELAREVNAARIAALDELTAHAPSGVPTLEEIVHIFMRPYFEPASKRSGALLAQMILRHRLDPTPQTTRIIREQFDPMATRFIDALVKACPEVSRDEFYWRYMFMVSSIVLTITDNSRANRIARLSEGRADATDTGQMAAALRRFIVGALHAPAPDARQ